MLDSFKAFEVNQGLRDFYSANEVTANFGDLIESRVGCRFQIPPQFQPQQSDSTIVWFTQSTRTFYQHILVSSIPKDQMHEDINMAEKHREDFINQHIKNEEDSRIIVSNSPYFKKAMEPITINGTKCNRLIGWYAEEGTFRRGIFHRYYFPKGDRVVILDAFAFAPNLPKSRFNRLFEIIAHTYRD